MPYNPYSLEGKLALVTGAGTGIGRGVALELARQGADVALSYASSSQGALEAVEEIKGMGRRAAAIRADLSQVGDCVRLVDEAAAFLGGLDGLVSNAGVTATIKFLDMTEEKFNHIFNLNIRGEYFCAQQAVRHMLQRGEDLRRSIPSGPGPAPASSTSRPSTDLWAVPGIRPTPARKGQSMPSAGSWQWSCCRRTSGST